MAAPALFVPLERDAAPVTPDPRFPPAFTLAEMNEMRLALGRTGCRTRLGALNHACKYFRRLVTRASGAAVAVHIDVTSAPAGWLVPVWVQAGHAAGTGGQAGAFDFALTIEVDWRAILAQVPEEAATLFWAGQDRVLQASFELVGRLGVRWEVEEAPDIDFVFWGPLRRLHVHPSRNGSATFSVQAATQSLRPVSQPAERPRGKGPPLQRGMTAGLIGGQDDADFMRAAMNHSVVHDSNLRWWPRSPFQECAQRFIPTFMQTHVKTGAESDKVTCVGFGLCSLCSSPCLTHSLVSGGS